jgi:hypothetical protein
MGLPSGRNPRTDTDAAREILEEGLNSHPEHPSLLYELACLDAIGGRNRDALAALARAIVIRPEIKAWARADEDFQVLHADPEFLAITAE